MNDGISDSYRQAFLQSVADLCDVDSVARHFDKYISQTCRRTFSHDVRTCRNYTKGPAWYDAECRRKRARAIKAGERISNDEDREKQMTACQQYRACKQRKQNARMKNDVLKISNLLILEIVAICGRYWTTLVKIHMKLMNRMTMTFIIILMNWVPLSMKIIFMLNTKQMLSNLSKNMSRELTQIVIIL